MMACDSSIPNSVRCSILKQIRQQNAVVSPFEALFRSHQELTDKLHAMKLSHDRLRAGTHAGASSEDAAKLREEMAEVYRQKAHNDQLLIDTTNRLQESERRCALLQKNENAEQVQLMRSAMERAEKKAREMQEANDVLRDEHIAVQAELSALQEKYAKVEADNKDLMDRWMKHKAEEADRMNLQNDDAARRLQQKVQRALSEAAAAFVPVDDEHCIQLPSSSGYTPSAVGDVLPTKCIARWPAHQGEATSARWSRTGHRLATGGSDRRLVLWAIVDEKGEKRSTLSGCNQSVMSIDFDADDVRVIGASNDGAIRMWSCNNERCQYVLSGHSSKVYAARFHAQGSQVVSGSQDKTLKIWDAATGRCLRTLFCGSTVHDVLTNDGSANAILSGHYDGKLRVWDTRNNEPLKDIQLAGKITSLDCGLESFLVLACTREDTLQMIDMRMNKIVHNYSGEAFYCAVDYTRAAMSPQGTYVACGSKDGHLFVWNTETTRIEKCLHKNAHDGHPIIATAWHPLGYQLATIDKKGVACVWSDI